jgi:hypothetical protein
MPLVLKELVQTIKNEFYDDKRRTACTDVINCSTSSKVKFTAK